MIKLILDSTAETFQKLLIVLSGGARREVTSHRHNAEINYVGSLIASGNTMAIHSYVVDRKGKVWDPITNNWGQITEAEYLERLNT